MSLQNLLDLNLQKNGYNVKQGLSKQRLDAVKPQVRALIAHWRQYPDHLVDFYCTHCSQEQQKGALKLFAYQRVMLRQMFRHNHSYFTYPRAYSKSFIAVLALTLQCVLYPGSNLFVTTGGKLIIFL